MSESIIVEPPSTFKSNGEKYNKLSAADKAIVDGFIDPDKLQEPRFEWDDKFQYRILGSFLADEGFMREGRALTKPGYFTNEAHALICRLAFAYYDNYKALPGKTVLFKELNEAVKNKDDSVQLWYKAELNSTFEFFVPGLVERRYILDSIRKFGQAQLLKSLCHDSLERQKTKGAADGWKLLRAGLLSAPVEATGPKILSGKELLSLPDTRWLLKDHFAYNSTGIVYGPYGSLKSFYVLEMALCVAAGLPFLGSYATAQGPTLYIAGEGADGLKLRYRAWLQQHGLEDVDGFHVIADRFNFAQPGEAAKLVGLVEASGVKPVLVVIDTVAKNIVGSDNDPEVMNNFSNALEEIRSLLDGACVVAVHHTGKDKSRGARGHTVLPAGVNTAFELDRTEAGCSVKCDKQKDGRELDPYHLTARTISLGVNGDGEPVSSLVLVPGQVVTPEQEQRHQEWDEEQAVLSALPVLDEKEVTPATAATVQSLLSKTGLADRFKLRRVLDRLKEKSGVMRWRKASTKEHTEECSGPNKPMLYWREKEWQNG